MQALRQIAFRILFGFMLLLATLSWSLGQTCPTDNRQPSNDRAIGRLCSGGCSNPTTAWILPNGRLATAGHSFDAPGPYVVEFNVPLSNSDGSIVHSAARDLYTVDETTIQMHTNAAGDDWAVFQVFPNGENFPLVI